MVSTYSTADISPSLPITLQQVTGWLKNHSPSIRRSGVGQNSTRAERHYGAAQLLSPTGCSLSARPAEGLLRHLRASALKRPLAM